MRQAPCKHPGARILGATLIGSGLVQWLAGMPAHEIVGSMEQGEENPLTRYLAACGHDLIVCHNCFRLPTARGSVIIGPAPRWIEGLLDRCLQLPRGPIMAWEMLEIIGKLRR